ETVNVEKASTVPRLECSRAGKKSQDGRWYHHLSRVAALHAGKRPTDSALLGIGDAGNQDPLVRCAAGPRDCVVRLARDRVRAGEREAQGRGYVHAGAEPGDIRTPNTTIECVSAGRQKRGEGVCVIVESVRVEP